MAGPSSNGILMALTWRIWPVYGNPDFLYLSPQSNGLPKSFDKAIKENPAIWRGF
jgi:hypothetical protein